MNNIYIYKNNFFDLIYLIDYLIKHSIVPNNIKDEAYSPTLLDNVINLNLNYEENIIKKIINNIDKNIFRILLLVFLSNDDSRELIIYYFYKNYLKYGIRIINMYNLKCVSKSLNISKYVSNEVHKYKGFVRFKELENNILYAEIEPINNILILLSNHFKKRLKNEYFIIKDKKREIFSIYNKNNYCIVNDNDFKLITNKLSIDELEYQKLWTSFYKTIGIESRRNDKCRMNFMPKRYWKYLIEMSDEL